MDIKVGDKFIWETGNKYRGDLDVTVTRVGRKYAYVAVDGGVEQREKFDRTTGIEVTGYSIASRLTTEAILAENLACGELVRELLAAGVDLSVPVARRLGYEALSTMLELVRPKSDV